MTDFPKLHCPFIRQTYKVNVDQWKIHGAKLEMRSPEVRLVINRVNPGYEWVFSDPDTIAVEKLNGTNMKVQTRGGRISAIQNRKNLIDPLQVVGGRGHLLEGIFAAIDRGYLPTNGETAGELIGPKLQGNPYKLTGHVFYPFEEAWKNLSYRSFHEHERTFDNFSTWFKTWLISRYYAKRVQKLRKDYDKNLAWGFPLAEDQVMAEGVVFINLRRRDEGKTFMAKLRRNMFDWFYTDKIEIYGYDKNNTPQPGQPIECPCCDGDIDISELGGN